MVSFHGGPTDGDDIAADVDRLGRLWLQDRDRPARCWIYYDGDEETNTEAWR